MKRVYGFNEGGKELIDILGGKGGNLAEMKRIGLPIPEGIIVSTTACKEFFRDGKNEGGKELIDILGGKGGNLAEMKRIGLPIPEGIIVSTTACKEFFRDGKKITPELEKEILEKLEYLQEVTGKRFEGDNPLLVSVRSGAPISMPGMMDTILNLGLNDVTAEKMSKIFNDEIFVHELYARFIQMFSEIVMGIEKELFFSRSLFMNFILDLFKCSLK